MTVPERMDGDLASQRRRLALWQRALSWALVFWVAAFAMIMAMIGYEAFQERRAWLIARFFPAVTDLTAQEWRKTDEGYWQARWYLDKRRAECVYVPDQIASVWVRNPDGRLFEAPISFIDDDTPGSNRATGWQSLNKAVRIDRAGVIEGALLTGTFLHRCREADIASREEGQQRPGGQLLATAFGPIRVGVNMALPAKACAELWPMIAERQERSGHKAGHNSRMVETMIPEECY